MKRAFTTVYCDPDYIKEATEALDQIVIGEGKVDLDFDYEPDWEIEDDDEEPTRDTGTYRGGYRKFRDGTEREDFGSDR